MRKKTLRLLALLLCLLLFSGSAAGDVTTVATGYVAETVLYGQAMCPTLLPGSEDGSVVVRWAAMNNRPVVVHYGADDGSGVLGEDHRTEKAQSAYSAMLGLHVYSAEIPLEPGELYLRPCGRGRGDAGAVLSSPLADRGELPGGHVLGQPHVQLEGSRPL